MNADVVTLGFIGLGVMGEPMCANLMRKSGVRVLVHDVDPAPVQRLAREHRAVPASIARISDEAQAVFLCLPSIEHVEQVCIGPGGLSEGKGALRRIIDTSTSDPLRTRELGRQLSERGLTLLDAPIARGPQGAQDGNLLIMVGGSAEDVGAVMPWLRCMGTDVIHCGGLGAGHTVKVLNNAVLMVNVHALAEALLIGEGLGVDGGQVLEVLALGTAASEALNLTGLRSLVPRWFEPGRFPVRYAVKDIALAAGLANAAGVEIEVMSATQALLQRTLHAGDGERYFCALIEHVRTAGTSAAIGATP